MKTNKYSIPFDVKSTSHFLKQYPDHPANKINLVRKLSEKERQELLKKTEGKNEEQCRTIRLLWQ